MLLAQYGWLIILAGVPLNVFAIWRRVRPVVVAHPELADGYRRILIWYAFWFSLPWAMMGVGCAVGGVPTIFHYLRPAAAGPFAWAFWAVAFGEFLLLAWWGVWGGGAEALVRHPGVLDCRTGSVRTTRWLLGGIGVFGVVWNAGILVWLA